MNKKDEKDIDLTHSEQEWFHSPEVRDEFRTNLRGRLIDYQKNNPSFAAPQKAKGIWNLFNWTIFKRLMPSGLAGGVISLLFALVLVSGVVYAVSKYAGYIPGYGMINQDVPVRVLSSVQSQSKDGIQLKIVSTIASQENTSVIYSIQGIPPSVFAGNDPLDPNIRKCSGEEVRLVLPNGQVFKALGSGSLGYGKENDYQSVVFFKTMPENVNAVTFEMPCIKGTLPKAAPENWSIPMTLEENANELKTFPILKVKTNAERETPNSIIVTELIPVEDKMIVLGRYIPDNKGIMVSSINQGTDITFLDLNGDRLPYNIPGDIQFFDQEEVGQFAFIVDANRASFPITLQIGGINYYCGGDIPYTIELKDFPTDNQIHNMEETLNVGSCQVKIVSIIKSGAKLTLRFESDGHKVTDVSIRDIHDPASFQTTTVKRFGNSVNTQLSATSLIKNKRMDLMIGGVGLGPLGPLSTKIELKDYQ